MSLDLKCNSHKVHIVGQSPWTRHVRRQIETVAENNATVLISGDSGTGKELIARAIHEQSERNRGPLIPVNCAAVSSPLFTSHMFGHVKGAFTGASCDTAGCFRAAEGGTIFLDEIGDLVPELQAKLLRTLQENTIIPVGSHREVPIDVRVVAATNRDLKQAVADGAFREDLYYRIQVITIETEPLLARPEDIQPLSEHFLAQMAVVRGIELKGLSSGSLQALRSYQWPGNVRELHNVLERAVVYCPSQTITPEYLMGLDNTARISREAMESPPSGSEPLSYGPPAHQITWQEEEWPSVSEMERELVKRTLNHTLFNQTAAAKLLGISRQTLLNKINKYGLNASHAQRSGKHNVPQQRPR